jgi:glutathione-regulated potassium-efflux system ancillary protein KefG
MGRRVDVDDLVDAASVADLLGLAQRTSVSVYQNRYPDMPRPVVDLGRGRPRLWLRSEIIGWARRTGRLAST